MPPSPLTLWFTEDRSRFFLVPDGQVFALGAFVIETLTDQRETVTMESLAPFEIADDQARRWAKDQLGQTLDELKIGINERLAELRRQLDEKDRTPVAEDATVTPNAAPPLFELLKKLPSVIGKSLSGDESRVESAKTEMANLQRQLKEAGIDLDERFTNFPDRVAHLRKDFEEQTAAKEPPPNEPDPQ
jgi:hypothetical protein